jgi:predicted secreted hydrolase
LTRRFGVLFRVLALAASLWLCGCGSERTERADARAAPPPLNALLQAIDEAYPSPPATRALSFPDDHGAHADVPMDAWRFAGTLRDGQDRRFGFQFMLIRLGLRPGAPKRASAWASHEVYRGLFALTDEANQRHRAFERFDRAALGLSGYQRSPTQRVWLGDWTVDVISGGGERPAFALRAAADGAGIDLRLESLKPVRSLGGTGSPESGGSRLRAYYISRMDASGTLTLANADIAVTGTAFLDHAFGRAFLSAGQLAWNRYWVQLDDGRELIALQFRRRDGSGEPVSSGLLIDRDARTRSLGRDELIIDPTGHWRSPVDGARYPTRWRLRLPGERLELDLVPLAEDQEVTQSLRAWSGAVAVAGSRDGLALRGSGYVELSGYTGSERR